MKKKITLGVCAAIVAAAAVFGLKSSMLAMSSKMIFNANVEALARGEGHGRAICYSQSVYVEGVSCLKCGICEYSDGLGVEKGGYCKW